MKVSQLFSICARYGSIAGVLAFLLLVGMYYMGKHPLLVSPFLDFRVILFGIFIFFSLKEFRDFHQDGLLYFWQGLIGGVIVVSTASLISSIGVYIFGKIVPTFVTSYIEQLIAYFKTYPPEEIERIGKEVFDRNLAALPATDIGALALTYLVHGIVIGFFINIILSVILRKTS